MFFSIADIMVKEGGLHVEHETMQTSRRRPSDREQLLAMRAIHHPRPSRARLDQQPELRIIDLTDRCGDFVVGDTFVWQDRPVELIDVTRLDDEWHQVVVRFLDRTTQPPLSMPYGDLIAGLPR